MKTSAGLIVSISYGWFGTHRERVKNACFNSNDKANDNSRQQRKAEWFVDGGSSTVVFRLPGRTRRLAGKRALAERRWLAHAKTFIGRDDNAEPNPTTHSGNIPPYLCACTYVYTNMSRTCIIFVSSDDNVIIGRKFISQLDPTIWLYKTSAGVCQTRLSTPDYVIYTSDLIDPGSQNNSSRSRGPKWRYAVDKI